MSEQQRLRALEFILAIDGVEHERPLELELEAARETLRPLTSIPALYELQQHRDCCATLQFRVED